MVPERGPKKNPKAGPKSGLGSCLLLEKRTTTASGARSNVVHDLLPKLFANHTSTTNGLCSGKLAFPIAALIKTAGDCHCPPDVRHPDTRKWPQNQEPETLDFRAQSDTSQQKLSGKGVDDIPKSIELEKGLGNSSISACARPPVPQHAEHAQRAPNTDHLFPKNLTLDSSQ